MTGRIADALATLPALCLLSSVVCASLWYICSRSPQAEKPRVYAKTSPLNDYVTEHCKGLTSSYEPPFYAVNGHVQTVLSTFTTRPQVKFTRELVTISDGGTVGLDWAGNDDDVPLTSPIILVIPGFTGDSKDATGLSFVSVQPSTTQ